LAKSSDIVVGIAAEPYEITDALAARPIDALLAIDPYAAF
jgi:hypothetical protein